MPQGVAGAAGATRIHNIVQRIVIGAMGPANVRRLFQPDTLLICPADREDVLRAAAEEFFHRGAEPVHHTGLRRGEEFGLQWEHVDFTAGVVTIPRSKSGEARRVPMNDTVRAVLRDLPSRLKNGWVFPSRTGKTALDAENFVRRVFLPALAAATIENFRWHDLRHTWASWLRQSGAVGLDMIQELGGWKQRSMVQRYSHLSVEHLASSAGVLDQLLAPVSGGGAQKVHIL